MNRRDFDIDHIDPRWEDGRDYQLICGLDCPLNYREEEPGKNSAKSNRFLPWRWSRDEIGMVPEEYGDLTQFLVDGEWVLMEFLSGEWFEATKTTCGVSEGTRKRILKDPEKHRANALEQWERTRSDPEQWAAACERLTTLGRQNWQDPEYRVRQSASRKQSWANRSLESRESRAQKISQALKGREDTVEKGRLSGALRFMCTVTGKVSNAGALSKWQRKRGIDPSNRIRLL